MLVKVWSPQGECFEVSHLNANDLVQHQGWSKTAPAKRRNAAAAPPPPPPAPVEDEEEFFEEEDETPPPPPPPPAPEEPLSGLAAKRAKRAAADAKLAAHAKNEAKRAPGVKRLEGTKDERGQDFQDDPTLSPEENHQRWLNTITAESRVGGTPNKADEDF